VRESETLNSAQRYLHG